ncbi:uncharacterized protein LOC117639608 isoform X2 [Thrips palmi]|uniref:Uncharacterized protein LOC117639608 isoform X2 n=1 Tax=Thrips palmi TaxID=161013 RepID=A0A6P8Y4I3_THRPL|nr:uncharacterized protein LOC117639608 isoform X2 [Thrips palmi]
MMYSDGMEFSALPDEVLLHALTFLTPATLLRCRAVCRRWKQLALHPLVWRSQTLRISGGRNTNKGMARHRQLRLATVVLRLAPCLGLLKVSDFGKVFDVVGPALINNSKFSLYDLDISFRSSDAFMVAMVLDRQASFGRLKAVRLRVLGHASQDAAVRRLGGLLLQLIRTPGLQSVEISIPSMPGDVTLPPLERPVLVSASLQRLSFVYNRGYFDLHLCVLLKLHTATLEEVKIATFDAHAAFLLSRMPRLRKLQCTVMDAMPLLQHCPSLRALRLDLRVDAGLHSTRARLSGLAAFLRAAGTRLHSVELVFGDDKPDELVDVVACLGGPGTASAALRRLAFSHSVTEDAEKPLLPLASILEHLPDLTFLDIDCVATDAFLEALDGSVLPQLLGLAVYLPRDVCKHVWSHGQRLRAVLRKNPRLHVVMKGNDCDEFCVCEFCQQYTCHHVPGDLKCIMYSHPTGARCGLLHDAHLEMRVFCRWF